MRNQWNIISFYYVSWNVNLTNAKPVGISINKLDLVPNRLDGRYRGRVNRYVQGGGSSPYTDLLRF